jgi:nitrile hydratase accessory protein
MTPIQLREDLLKEPAPPLLRDDGAPPFRDLWEAEAFAIGNLLIKEGVITCKEWETVMSEAILRAQAAGDPDHGDTYFNHWADALETILISHGMTDRESLSEQQALWDRAMITIIITRITGITMIMTTVTIMFMGQWMPRRCGG